MSDVFVPVVVETELYGESIAIARELHARSAMLHMVYAPPLGTVVVIRIGEGAVAIGVRAEVTHHRYELHVPKGWPVPLDLRDPPRLIGVRFLEFIDGGEPAIAAQIQ